MMKITVTKNDEAMFKISVIRELIDTFNLEKEDAIAAFDNSPLLEMLRDIPEHIYHYDAEYWANDLLKMRKKFHQPA